MEIVHARCAGLDVHKKTVVACVRIGDDASTRAVRHELATFGTTTPALLALAEWLHAHEVVHVVLAATGVYWKPVWHVLESDFTLLLANAHEVKAVPGRKSDVKDAAWLADLLAHGLVRSSFVPPAPIQELRDLTRTRKQLVGERSQHVQRLQKVLEDANVKLSSVVTDVLGASGRAMLEGLLTGTATPAELARLAHGRVRAPRAEISAALDGRVRDHHRFMVRLHLRHIDELDCVIASLEGRIEASLAPLGGIRQRLLTIPGVSSTIGAVLLAEIGVEMRWFPSAAHLVSWACLAPRSDQSAGKRRSTRTRRGQWLKAALVQGAWAAVRQRDTYLHAQFHRIRARRGAKKAILAVAASMLTAAYYIIRDGTEFQDLGGDYFVRRTPEHHARRLVHRLQNMGYAVHLSPAA